MLGSSEAKVNDYSKKKHAACYPQHIQRRSHGSIPCLEANRLIGGVNGSTLLEYLSEMPDSDRMNW